MSFARSRFAAQFMNRRRSPAGEPAIASPGTNNTSAVNGYDAYFGTYRADAAAGTINVRLEGALSPENVGLEATREVRVVGDRLLIRLATTAADGTPITRTLAFERLK